MRTKGAVHWDRQLEQWWAEIEWVEDGIVRRDTEWFIYHEDAVNFSKTRER